MTLVLILEAREGGRKEDRAFCFCFVFVLTPTELRKLHRGSEMNLQFNLQLGRKLLAKQTCHLNAVSLAA